MFQYRFSPSILILSSQSILENPKNLPKNLSAKIVKIYTKCTLTNSDRENSAEKMNAMLQNVLLLYCTKVDMQTSLFVYSDNQSILWDQ